MCNLQNDYIWRYKSKTILFNSKKELVEAIGNSGFEELEKDMPTKFTYKRDRYVYDSETRRNRIRKIELEGPDYQILPTLEFTDNRIYVIQWLQTNNDFIDLRNQVRLLENKVVLLQSLVSQLQNERKQFFSELDNRQLECRKCQHTSQ